MKGALIRAGMREIDASISRSNTFLLAKIVISFRLAATKMVVKWVENDKQSAILPPHGLRVVSEFGIPEESA